MANEFRHKNEVNEFDLYLADWRGTGTHIFNSQAIGDILYATSSAQLSRRAIGATNEVLVVIGGVPTWQSTLAGLTLTSPTINFAIDEYASAQTLTANNYLVLVNASSGDITVTLPAAASHTNRIYTIKKIDSSEHTVTIDANSNEKIDGEETIDLNLQYQYITIACDGDEWFIIGGEYVKMEDILRETKEVQENLLEVLKFIMVCLSKMSDLEFKED